MMMDVEGICRKLKPILGKKAVELWYRWLASNWQEKRDLEVIIQMIAEKTLKDSPLEEKNILLPPPAEEQAQGDFILGNVVYRNKYQFPLYLKESDLIRQTGIFATTGSGKSNAAMLIALELLKKDKPFMVIDWKRQYRSMFSIEGFPNLDKMEIYTIGRDVVPFLWNPFRPPPNVDRRTWISVIIECLEKSHLAGPGVGDFIIRIYEKLFRAIKDENFYPNFYDGLRELEQHTPDGREYLWWQSTKRILRTFTFGPGSKSFNTRNPVKLEELLGKPVILELDQEMPKPLRVFLQEILLRFIHLYRLSQGETSELRHCLFMEEIHNLTRHSKPGSARDDVDSLENVFREIRSFGQGLVSITQHISLVPSYITGNLHTLILLAQQHEDDVTASRKALFLPRDDEVYLNLLKTGFGIVKVMERISPCLVQFFYVPIEKGKITDEWLRKNKGGISAPSSPEEAKFDQSRGISAGDISTPEIGEIPPRESPAGRLLVDVFLHPLAGVTERYKRLGLNSREGNQYKKMLVSEKLIHVEIITTGTGWITLFELTPRGRWFLQNWGYTVKDEASEGLVHKFWKFRISEYYRKEGFDVLVEERINGKPDVIVIGKGKRIAVEVETGQSYALENIAKNLKAGFDEILCVATRKEFEEKIREQVNASDGIDGRVKITSVFEFDI